MKNVLLMLLPSFVRPIYRLFAQADIAPTGTLRAAYLATNPAQATKDPQTGEVARRRRSILRANLPSGSTSRCDFKATANPPAVIEAVKSGQADIGFVAYEATRLGTVEFSDTYMVVQQSFLVPGDSPMRAVADVDKRRAEDRRARETIS